ncbi:MAG: 1-acyl-sn-glycerol-3-phosphate acyltransferase [Deltaproteobacteria bacterium]|nr:1-acyl-sn-glycerol-3-phosphate acyltransferase [Deltaproteobacteria bacterium]
MLDLDYLQKYNLSSYSWGQHCIGATFLMPNYNLFRKVRIIVEGKENLPLNNNAIYAMNHTDRFNYWPFQYYLWRNGYVETTVWVKGKYYRNFFLAKMLSLANCIPVPSLGYYIEEFYRMRNKSRITRDDYRTVRDVIDGKNFKDSGLVREMLGSGGVSFIRAYYERALAEVARLTSSALFAKHLSLIIFPEGTRSLEFQKGLTGIGQVALHSRKPLIPVACNNSEEIYPNSSPIARSGTIIYRVGKPLTVRDELKPYRIDKSFDLLSSLSRSMYEDRFRAVTNIVMERIGEMLDDKYRRAPE